VERPGNGEVRGPRTGLPPLAIYLLKNGPELTLIGLGLWLVYEHGWLSGRVCAALFAAIAIKDVLLYPYLRPALRTDTTPLVGPEHLIGAWAVVEQALAPSGMVRIKGERWRGESLDGPAPVGQRVRVVAVRGLTLLVSSEAA
jgi:membrane protein implicated in regulation of membrane protease activity